MIIALGSSSRGASSLLFGRKLVSAQRGLERYHDCGFARKSSAMSAFSATFVPRR